MEAIGILEELLKIKKLHFGTTSKEFTRTCKQLCEICNILAVYYLKKEDINSALDLLKKSEELCENNELGQAMTFNNMACYYRRIGKMRTALNFLQRALTIESRLQRPASGALMLPIPASGLLTGVENVDVAEAIPGVDEVTMTVAVGRRVEALPEGDRYLGFVIASGPSPDEVEATLREADGAPSFAAIPEGSGQRLLVTGARLKSLRGTGAASFVV